MRSCFICLLGTLLFPMMSQAHSLRIDTQPPAVKVDHRGELQQHGDKTVYQVWSSQQLTGKVRVIQHIAGRSSAKELNASLIEAIKAAKLPQDRYQTTTIVNLDDAMFGTGSFVVSSLEKSKRQFPWSSFVLDESGSVRQSWGIAEESSAILLLDKTGTIRFVKDGALTQAEIKQVMTLIQSLI